MKMCQHTSGAVQLIRLGCRDCQVFLLFDLKICKGKKSTSLRWITQENTEHRESFLLVWKRTSTVLYVFILQKNLNEQDLPPKYFWTNFNQTGKCETNPTSPNTVHGSLFSSHPIHSEQISRVVPRHFDIETCTFLEGTVL